MSWIRKRTTSLFIVCVREKVNSNASLSNKIEKIWKWKNSDKCGICLLNYFDSRVIKMVTKSSVMFVKLGFIKYVWVKKKVHMWKMFGTETVSPFYHKYTTRGTISIYRFNKIFLKLYIVRFFSFNAIQPLFEVHRYCLQVFM